jgi:hypothetical protein
MQEMEFPPQIVWITEESEKDYEQACQHSLNDCDFAIITTLPPKKSRLDNLYFRNPVFLLIHNTCFQLWRDFHAQGHQNLWPLVRQFIKWIMFRLSGESKRQNQWLEKSNNIIFSSYFMKKYYFDNTSSNLWPNPLVIPSGHHISPQNKHFQPGKLKIGIPGNINASKKDYLILREGLKHFAKSHHGDIEVIFMGKCNARESKLVCKMETKFHSCSIKVVTYPDYLSHREYTSLLSEVDLLIWNFKKIKPYGPCNEWFGYTTESGAVGDMIKFGIPSVIPDFYPIAADLENLVVRYHDARSMASAISSLMAKKHILTGKAGLSSWQHPDIGKYILQQLDEYVE